MTSFAASRATSARTTSPGGRSEAPFILASPLTAGSCSRMSTTSSDRVVGVRIRRCNMHTVCRARVERTGAFALHPYRFREESARCLLTG